MISFTQLQTTYGTLSQNTSTENLALGAQLMNIEQRYLLQKYFSNEGTYTSVTVSQQQFYKMPPNYSKLKTITINVGSLKYTPIQVLTREEWDRLNAFPYYGDIPNYYFIYPGGDHNGQIGIFPIPSSAGNTITFNYKFRVPDLSMADYSTGTINLTTLTTAVTGAGTVFVPTANAQNESRWIQIAQPKGDNLWYQIATVDTTTGLTLYSPYQGISVVGGSFTIGQMPILMEDFHDMLIWKALTYYFSSIVSDPKKKQEFQDMYDSKLELLAEYAGSKTIHVNLGRQPVNMNPNLFVQDIS